MSKAAISEKMGWPLEKPVTKAEYSALATFRRTLREYLHFSEAAARQSGLTPQQHQAMLAINGAPDSEHVTMGRLADNLQIRHNSAVGLTDRLAAQGLAARCHGDADRRIVYVNLTSKGRDVLEGLTSAHRGELRRLGPRFMQLMAHFGAEEG